MLLWVCDFVHMSDVQLSWLERLHGKQYLTNGIVGRGFESHSGIFFQQIWLCDIVYPLCVKSSYFLNKFTQTVKFVSKTWIFDNMDVMSHCWIILLWVCDFVHMSDSSVGRATSRYEVHCTCKRICWSWVWIPLRHIVPVNMTMWYSLCSVLKKIYKYYMHVLGLSR